MQVCGIIAEYNPFHSGHAYQITEARKQSGCDYVIVVMSGDFVQRGAPALTDKYIRAKQALEHGADLVLMLPVYGSTASAEGFARAGIAALLTTGVVDTLSFGCENPDICSDSCRYLAEKLRTENAAFRDALAEGLSAGMTYAKARVAAIKICYEESYDPALLERPNNLLAFEYLRALEYFGKKMNVCPVQRLGGYHDMSAAVTTDAGEAACDLHTPETIDSLHIPEAACDPRLTQPDLSHRYASASSCRQALLSNCSEAFLTLETNGQIPAKACKALRDYAGAYTFLQENDLSQMLYYALVTQQETGFETYLDCGSDLSGRIIRNLDKYENFSQFCDLLKNKSVTRARIARTLTHILLQLPAQMPAPLVSIEGTLPYLRILGFHENAAPLLHEIRQRAHAPLITRAAKASKLLAPESFSYFRQDVLASEIYRSMVREKCGHCYPDDYRRKILSPFYCNQQTLSL